MAGDGRVEAGGVGTAGEDLVEVSGLGRRFGRRQALEGVELSVAPGEIVGLVGPNGSGKTTLLKILSGFLRPTAGDARVFGERPFDGAVRIMERARFAFAPPPLFGSLTAFEHLRYLSNLQRGVRVRREEMRDALAQVGLGDRANDRVRTFSFGMRQRLALALCLLPPPELLVLDEPTDGLDPLGIQELRALLLCMREEHGMGILLSSHLLGELERLADRVLVLDEGRTVFYGEPEELTRDSRRLRIRVNDDEEALGVLGKSGIDARRVTDGELELPADSLSLRAAWELLHANGIELRGHHHTELGLEEALLERLAAFGRRKEGGE